MAGIGETGGEEHGRRWCIRIRDRCGLGAVHLPVAVAPVGQTTGGLPVGIQSVAGMYNDRIAGVIGGFRVPPGFA